MEKLDGKTRDVVQDNIEKLKQLFPEVFTEEKIDFEKLQLTLGEHIETEKERYEFNWNGKTEAIQLAQKQSTGTLRPCKEESVEWDTTQNLYIEGDNLEVLRLLQDSYRNKVKMIYIDPPYNTGEDFIYKDNFHEDLSNYKNKMDENYKSNPETNGRYHTDWLNMMYTRLKVARNLLKEDGVIFISIGDKEISNLRKICDEIFGENNFEGHIHWRRRHNQPNDKKKMIGIVAEHILAYAKNSVILKNRGVGKIDLTGEFSNPDNDPNGEWASKPWKVGSDQSGSRYTITSPTGKVFKEEWMGEEGNFMKMLEEGRMFFTRNGDGLPRKKYYKFEREAEGQCATNWWSHEVFGHNQGGNETMTGLFGEKNLFSNPKPIELIRGLLQIGNVKDDDLVLDFFSGSSTTAQSTLEMNIEDGVNIKFIMIQLPENLESSYKVATGNEKKTIENAMTFLKKNNKKLLLSEIGKERIRRAGQKIKEENKDKEGIEDLDIGFKVFKLDETNLKIWDEEAEEIEDNLLFFESAVKEGRSQEDVLYEILLKYGLDLTLPIEEEKVGNLTAFSVGLGYLVVCLDQNLSANDIEQLVSNYPDCQRMVFLDNGFATDEVKINAEQILKRNGVQDIRVI